MSPGQKMGFTLLGLANLFTIVFPIVAMARLMSLARQGVSGTEFGALLLGPLIVLGVLVAIVNIVVFGRYLWKQHPSTLGRIIGFPVIALSVVIVLGAVYSVVTGIIEHRQRVAEMNAQPADRHYGSNKAVRFTNITATEAEQLLLACDLTGFYFTRQTRPAMGNSGELSPTGVVLTSIDSDPTRISIANHWIDRLVPVAREAQDTCGPGQPQFWYKGHYE